MLLLFFPAFDKSAVDEQKVFFHDELPGAALLYPIHPVLKTLFSFALMPSRSQDRMARIVSGRSY